jgi:uncharacterized protein
VVRGILRRHEAADVCLGTLLDTNEINQALLLPILAHCVADQGLPLLGPTRKGPEGKAFMRKAYTEIPTVVEAIRQYWMPIRYRRDP